MAASFKILGYNTYDCFDNLFYLQREWIEVFEGRGLSRSEGKNRSVQLVSESRISSLFYEI